jgi:hypothetical protein
MNSSSGLRPAPAEDLWARQADLQAEAAAVLAELDLAAIVADVGPMLLAGSYVSGPDVLAGPGRRVFVGAE